MATPFPNILAETSLTALQSAASGSNDALVVVYSKLDTLRNHSQIFPAEIGISSVVEGHFAINKEFGTEPAVVHALGAPGQRLVLAPTEGSGLDDDTDDVRKIRDAVKGGISKAIKAGSRNPVLYLPEQPPNDSEDGNGTYISAEADYSHWVEVALLSALNTSYVTLVVREFNDAKNPSTSANLNEKLDSITLVVPGVSDRTLADIVSRTEALEKGRRLCQDMGYGDPERMTPYKCAEHIKQVFCGLDNVTYEEVKDIETIKREYPLLYHSSRASLAAKNTWPCVVKLRYRSSNRSDVKEHMYLVGKGVTYDTGGISIKTGGAMRGMSRDKLGACGVAGFVLSAALLKTTEVDITALLPFERNSVGPDSLLPDEILITRAGVRVLINDTDAEGRLIMADSICECKEEIVKSRKEAQKSGQPAVPSSIFTVATLTGHVIRAYGWYGASVANGPARKAGYDQRLAKSGKAWGDPFECSILRRDDFDFIAAKTDREDVYQTNDKASVSTSRGHMFPAAFLIKATGLDQHSLASGPENRIPFIHMDVAGSAEDGIEPGLGLPGITGSPICVLAGAFLNI